MFCFTKKMCKPLLLSAKEAVADIVSGSVVCAGGFGYCGTPFELYEELHKTDAKDLTLITFTVPGEDFGVGPLVSSGQVKKVITSYMGENKVLSKYFHNGKVEVELCPMGSLAYRLNSAGTGVHGFYVATGYGTAVSEGTIPQRFDPDNPSRVLEYSPRRETRLINGKWCCFETALPADFAIIRAWKADKRGNLVFRATARNFNLAAARCAKTCIAEVEEIVECGELDPNFIHLSGVYVKRLVHVPQLSKKIEFLITKDKEDSSNVNHEDTKHRIARRAALEVQDGMLLNLGIGIPTLTTMYIEPGSDVVLMSGNGLLGMGDFPTRDEVDPDLVNSSKQTTTIDKHVGACLVDGVEAMGITRAGLVDMAMMGAMEVAENGDLANWMVPGKRISGMGGGMELVQSGCKVVILTSHTNNDGSAKIVHRCHAPLTGHGVVDMIITELAVFRVIKRSSGVNSLELIEIADGHTQEEVRAKTEAAYSVSPKLCTMQQAPIPLLQQ